MEMGEKNSFGISRYKIAAALVCAIALTAAVSALVTMSVLCDRGSADLGGTYELGQDARLSLLPCEGDVDGGAAPFFIYEMPGDPDDDSLKVMMKGKAERPGDDCVVLYGPDGGFEGTIIKGDKDHYYIRDGKAPVIVTKIDDEAVVPE